MERKLLTMLEETHQTGGAPSSANPRSRGAGRQPKPARHMQRWNPNQAADSIMNVTPFAVAVSPSRHTPAPPSRAVCLTLARCLFGDAGAGFFACAVVPGAVRAGNAEHAEPQVDDQRAAQRQGGSAGALDL